MFTSGAVLTGGRSRRMGADKALLSLESGSMIDHMVETLEGAVDDVRLVGGDIGHSRVETVADRYPDEGPLGGVVSALDATDAELTAVVGCDLPRLTSAVVLGLIDATRETGADYAIPLIGGRRQWHCAVWTNRCTSRLSRSFDDGIRSFRPAVAGLRECAVLLSDPRIFDDIDTPEDYERYLSSEGNSAVGEHG